MVVADAAPDQQSSDLIDIRAAARLAGRSPETIRRWVWSGRLPARRRGNRLYVAPGDVTALVVGRGGNRALTLGQWAHSVAAAFGERGDEGDRSAADLVLEDRRLRSGGGGASGRR